jgi:hypothetical protein
MTAFEQLETTQGVKVTLLHPEDFQEVLTRASEHDIMESPSPTVPVKVDGRAYEATVFPTITAKLGQLSMELNSTDEGDYTHLFVVAVNDTDSTRGWHIPEGSIVVIVKGDDSEVVNMFFDMTDEEQLRLQGHH